MNDFNWLLRKAGFVTPKLKVDRKRAAAFLEVSERTFERWQSQNKACPRAIKLLKIYSEGKIFHEAWDGFLIDKDGDLYTPEGNRYGPDFIRKIHFMQRASHFQDSQLASLDTKVKNLKHVEKMKEEISKLSQQITEIINKEEVSYRPINQGLKLVKI
ncbi:MAG: hypothetical protein O3A45_04235 [Proteobacteria bacterium]|nr:hypothetical protein [Pseudomonadota bacterium]